MSAEAVQVLLIEDNPTDALLVADMLAGAAMEEFCLTHLPRLDAGLDHLARNRVDVVLLDLQLPDADGLLAVQRVCSAAPAVPIVVLSGGRHDRQAALEALRQGAQDYLVKGSTEEKELFRSIRYAMERHRAVAQGNDMKKQLRMKDEFFSHVSHELRSPLTAICEFASILADGIAGECTASQRGYLNIILRNAGQLESMIGDLLEVTRAETGKLTIEPQRTSLQAIAQEAVETISAAAAARRLTLGTHFELDTPPVYADPQRLRQVFLNLLNNAIKFTPERGAITVRTEMSKHQPGLTVGIVSDTGCGISTDAADRIFERLYQASDNSGEAGRKGLGLGLYISRELIHRQGGNIWVESEVGRGSTFFFTVPSFSLAGILAPILSSGRRRESLALISVSVISRGGWSSAEARASAVRSGLHLLRRCVLPDLDVVLPQMESPGGIERLFIVANANASGAEILVNRIRGQIERSLELQDPSLIWEVSWDAVVIPNDVDGLPESEFCTAVADLITKKVDTYGCAGSKNEQEENSYR